MLFGFKGLDFGRMGGVPGLSAPAGSGPPVNVLPASVSGTPQVGVAFTAFPGTWTGAQPITLTYQWQKNSVDISLATSLSYTPLAGDVGATLRIIVTANNSAGGPVTSTSGQSPAIINPLAPPVNTLAPVLSGTPMVGNVLSITQGNWTGNPTPTYVYQFYMGATPVGSNTNSYVCAAGDVGKIPTCVVTASNSQGSVPATSNALSAVITNAPVNTVAPTLSTTSVSVGVQVTCSPGTWTGSPSPTLAQRWQISANGTTGWTDIPGEITNAYSPAVGDVGKFIRGVVNGSNTVAPYPPGVDAPSNVSLAVASSPIVLAAPIATWVSADTVAQAIFQLDAPPGIVATNKIWGQAATDAAFTAVFDTANAVINAADLIDFQIDNFAFLPFTSGLKYCRFWISDGADVRISQYSNTVSQTMNVASTITGGPLYQLLFAA